MTKFEINLILYAYYQLVTYYTRMKKITVNDMRRAISYVNNGNCVIGDLRDVSDEDLCACDFLKDLKMGNIRKANVPIQLMRRYNIGLPLEIFHNAKDNTVGGLMDAINEYLVANGIVNEEDNEADTQ